MAYKNDFSTTFLKVGMKFKNAEKLVNYLIDKNIIMKGTVLLAMLGSKQMYEIIIKKCDPNAKIVIADSDLVTDYFENYKNIICINIDENDADDFYNKLKNMPNFDFVVQNPPYSGSLHLDFLKKGYEMLSDKGQMIIIEPATWLINVRKYGKRGEEMRVNSSAIKKYDELKKTLEGKIKKIVIENYNEEFSTNMLVPFSISYIDKLYNSNDIEYKVFGDKRIVKSLYDINLIGNYEIIWSILNKIKIDKLKNHIYEPGKSTKIINNWYCKFAGIIVGISGTMCNAFDCGRNPRELSKIDYDNYFNADTLFTSNLSNAYTVTMYHRYKNEISPDPLHKYDRGKNETEFEAACITGTKEELENWKHFVFNNTLPLFINIVMTIDQHNNSLDYVPWLVDKKYTDKEIYEKFNFTEDEIKLIEITIKKYNRYSPWFRRYICGQKSATDEEVQKFIEDLNNA